MNPLRYAIRRLRKPPGFIGLLAALLPALRATKADPVAALRAE